MNNYEDNQLKEYHICLFEIYHADDHVDDFIKLLNIGYDLTNKKAGGFTFVESLVVYHVDYQEEKVKDAVYKLIKTHLKKTDIERLANIQNKFGRVMNTYWLEENYNSKFGMKLKFDHDPVKPLIPAKAAKKTIDFESDAEKYIK